MPVFSGTGVIGRVGDADWFAVNLTPGQVYVLSSNQPSLALAVRNVFGEVVRAPFDPLFGGYAFRATGSGTYYVEAGGVVFPGTLPFTGDYVLAVSSVDGDPIRGDTGTDRTIAPGENYSVSYPSILAARTDDDWWAADLVAGRSYSATTTSGDIYVADASGRVIEIDAVAGAVQFTPVSGGRYYFGVSPTGMEVYTVRLDEVTDDYADTINTVGRIAVGGPAGGSLEVAGDEDWFQAQLDAGTLYRLVTTTPQTSVYDAAGNLVGANLEYFQPQRTGTYYVAASGPTGRYSVTLEPVTGGVPGNTTTDQTLVPGDGPRGTQLLGRGDEDWYRISLVAGRSYAIGVTADVTIRVLDAGGNPVFGAPSGDVRSFTPHGTGTYYIAVGNPGTGPVTYFINVGQYTDDFGANFINTGRISPDTVVTGNFEVRGDRDWFAVDLRSGVSYFVDSTANVIVRDANFQPVTTSADRAFTPQFNGLYYVEAISGTNTGAYTFSLTSFTDDYVDNVSTRGRLTIGGDTPPNPNPNPNPGTTPTTGDDSLTGTGGNDTIDALAGNDTIRGLGGDDVLVGGPGNDLIDGGSGSDTADFSSYAGGASVNLNLTGAQNTGQGTDTFVSIENLRGGAGGDVFVGDDGANILEDRVGGSDNLLGNGGDDTLTLFRAATNGTGQAYVVRGGDGNDTITVDGNGPNDQAAIDGGAGADVIDLRDLGNTTVDLGSGDDRLTVDVRTGSYSVTLGDGVDTIIPLDRGTTPRLTGAISISGFTKGAASGGGDTIDLRPYLASVFPTYAASADPFADGRVRLLDAPGGVLVQIDRDGAGTAFGFETLLTLTGLSGVSGFTPNNFLTGAGGGGGGGNGITGTELSETLMGTSAADSISGLGGNDVLMGDAGDDTLLGGAGDDTLNGGPGTDRLEGGAGSDTYLVDAQSDVVVEARGGGFADTVYAVNSYTLTADAEVENFAAAVGSSTTGLTLVGNQLGQAIAGTYGNDTIQGGGGGVNGGDILIGLRGDDSYRVDAANVLIFEAAGEGNDTAIVLASGSGFVLNAEGEVETLQAETGTANIAITGNMQAQRIVGNAGNNQLSSGGGGADTLDGGAGDDTYRVHGTVEILDSEGNDAIYTSGSFRLTGFAQIELISTAVHLFADPINITGNTSSQTIVGNFGNNVLDGGSGLDTLIGLQGADTFRFSTNLGNGNVDTITDFVSGTDRIVLTSDVFSGIGATFTAANFGNGVFATTADQRILYDQPTGRLFYDSDGTGGAPSQLFALLAAGTPLAASDISVIAPVPSA